MVAVWTFHVLPQNLLLVGLPEGVDEEAEDVGVAVGRRGSYGLDQESLLPRSETEIAVGSELLLGVAGASVAAAVAARRGRLAMQVHAEVALGTIEDRVCQFCAVSQTACAGSPQQVGCALVSVWFLCVHILSEVFKTFDAVLISRLLPVVILVFLQPTMVVEKIDWGFAES